MALIHGLKWYVSSKSDGEEVKWVVECKRRGELWESAREVFDAVTVYNGHFTQFGESTPSLMNHKSSLANLYPNFFLFSSCATSQIAEASRIELPYIDGERILMHCNVESTLLDLVILFGSRNFA
ncbi:hypothetical protein Sjap_014096 [Stephania japonica]|uniref:Uncharacterized protein n=1 Tax=Stephania japonica TaxID=461633 RepID=A0AAP0NZN1_9MAGN